MRLLSTVGTVQGRLFLICVLVYSAFFTTNVVREHYPAFSLIDHGNFRVDEYLGFHSDIVFGICVAIWQLGARYEVRGKQQTSAPGTPL